MDALVVRKVDSDADMLAALAIREKVFVVEQHCPPELENENDDVSVHFIALLDGHPAGAARWRRTSNGYKLERFAVLKEFRHRGVASALVRAILNDMPNDNEARYLHAQLDAVPLYAKFNFQSVGEEFTEANIRHRHMKLAPGVK